MVHNRPLPAPEALGVQRRLLGPPRDPARVPGRPVSVDHCCSLSCAGDEQITGPSSSSRWCGPRTSSRSWLDARSRNQLNRLNQNLHLTRCRSVLHSSPPIKASSFTKLLPTVSSCPSHNDPACWDCQGRKPRSSQGRGLPRVTCNSVSSLDPTQASLPAHSPSQPQLLA